MRFNGSEEYEFIVHRSTPNNLSHDFIVKGLLRTDFLNRDPDRASLCDLYRGNKNYKDCTVETFLDDEDYSERVEAEDKELAEYTKKVSMPEED